MSRPHPTWPHGRSSGLSPGLSTGCWRPSPHPHAAARAGAVHLQPLTSTPTFLQALVRGWPPWRRHCDARKSGVEVAVSTAREGPGRSRLPGRGCGPHSDSIPVAGPGWASTSPWADAMPPPTSGWEPQARLGCQDQEARASEGPPLLLGMTSPTGMGTAHRGICAPVVASFHQQRPRSWAPWGLGACRAGSRHTDDMWLARALPPSCTAHLSPGPRVRGGSPPLAGMTWWGSSLGYPDPVRDPSRAVPRPTHHTARQGGSQRMTVMTH